MNPDSMVFVARPRNGYEAVDLGFTMVRQWWKTLYLSWLVVTLPLFLLLLWLFDGNGWTGVILWWLKPLFERTHLFILSRAVFGECPGWRETVAAFRHYGRMQLLQSLTWRRLSPTRSLDLAVMQLEGLKGAERSRRLNILHRDKTSSVASWLTIIGIHLEAIIEFSLVAAIVILLPQQLDLNFSEFLEAPYVADSLFYVAMTLFAPFYVAGGFALYLNRRTLLEGWDIELSFRRLKARAAQSAKSRRYGQTTAVSMSFLVTVFSAALLFTPPPLMADEAPLVSESLTESHSEPLPELIPELSTEGYSTANAKADIQQVLQGDDFHQRKTERMPKFVADWNPEFDKSNDATMPDVPEWLKKTVLFLASSLEAILWLALAVIILLLIYRYRNAIVSFSLPRRRSEKTALPETLFDLDVSQQSLPDDIPAEVLALWHNNQPREAVSLLYRGTLSRLIHHYQLAFKQSDTEQDCVNRVRQQTGTEVTVYFVRLTALWERLAYGHQLPALDQLSILCDRWAALFAASQQESASIAQQELTGNREDAVASKGGHHDAA